MLRYYQGFSILNTNVSQILSSAQSWISENKNSNSVNTRDLRAYFLSYKTKYLSTTNNVN